MLLDATVLEDDFTHEIEAHRLGSLGASNVSQRIWYQLFAKQDKLLPEAPERSSCPPVARRLDVEPRPTKPSREIYFELSTTPVLEIVQKDDGHYCVIGISAEQKSLVDALIAATRENVEKHVADAHKLHFRSPVRDATQEEVAEGIVARLLTKISVFAQRMTSFSIRSKANQLILGPGSSISELCDLPPLGHCNVSLNLMGFWHDERVVVPTIYLNMAQFASPPPMHKMSTASNSLQIHTDLTVHNLLCGSTTKIPCGSSSAPDGHSEDDALEGDSTFAALSSVAFPINIERGPLSSSTTHSSTSSFMSQASTMEHVDSDTERSDLETTPPLKHADVALAQCKALPMSMGETSSPLKPKGKAPFLKLVELPGDAVSRSHPNPQVRSIFSPQKFE